MTTNDFLDYLHEHQATTQLAEPLTALIYGRRASAARHALVADAQATQQVRVAS